MLKLSRDKDQKVFAGSYTGSEKVPLENTVVEIKNNKPVLGYEAKTSRGEPSKLLSFSRDDINNQKNEKKIDTLNKQLKLQEHDESLLNEFLESLKLGIILDNLNQAINKFKENPPYKIQELIQFVSLINNGAFFKHWADHYAEQAKKMFNSLGLKTQAA